MTQQVPAVPISHASPEGVPLVVDLGHELRVLRAEPLRAAGGRRQKAIFKSEGRTIMLIDMDEGAALPEHSAPGVVSVQVLEGTLRMNVEGASSLVPAGSMLIMRPGARHDVRAIGPSAFVLQISAPQRPA